MPLSTGGMGEVFLARLEGSHGFDKPCVIKKILPHLAKEPGFVSRFVDEGHILVKLSHGNIAQVLDMGVNDNAPYIALEFVDGKDLRRVLARTRERSLPLPLSFVLSVMTRVLDALAYAHRKRGEDDRELNLVHRDVSPQNVLISYEGEVKVIDFGLAKSAMSVSNTNPSILLGKFMYMSPEQARHKPVDRRADLYSVGLCLWELIAGKNPFEDVPSGEMIARVGNPTISALNTIDPLCPRALSDAVVKALQVDPAQRFQSAEEFRAALQSILTAIDPQAGAESTSRFMRDAFATEYQQERRMLSSLKEQARSLDAAPERGAHEETLQPNTRSPFAARQSFLKGDEPTPIASKALELQPTALSFAPTPKTVQLSGTPKKDDVHEKETLPAIQLKTDLSKTPGPSAALPPMAFAGEPELDASLEQEAPPAPPPKIQTPPPSAGAAPIRAKVLTKSFDNEPTEAAAPAIPSIHTSETARALEPLPSIMLEGIETAPPPPATPEPRATPAKKKAPLKPRRTNSKTLKQPTPPTPPSPPSGPLRTDTMVIRNPLLDPPPRAAAPVKKSNTWLWFVVPLLAILAVGAFIAWDMHLEQTRKQADDAGQETPAPETQ